MSSFSAIYRPLCRGLEATPCSLLLPGLQASRPGFLANYRSIADEMPTPATGRQDSPVLWRMILPVASVTAHTFPRARRFRRGAAPQPVDDRRAMRADGGTHVVSKVRPRGHGNEVGPRPGGAQSGCGPGLPAVVRCSKLALLPIACRLFRGHQVCPGVCVTTVTCVIGEQAARLGIVLHRRRLFCE